MTTDERDKLVHVDRVFQTVGGVLLTACLGLVTWSLKTTMEHETRIAVVETKTISTQAEFHRVSTDLSEIRKDIKEIAAALNKKP